MLLQLLFKLHKKIMQHHPKSVPFPFLLMQLLFFLCPRVAAVSQGRKAAELRDKPREVAIGMVEGLLSTGGTSRSLAVAVIPICRRETFYKTE